MNIIKPMQQGLMTRTFVKNNKYYLSVASLSFFPFHNPVSLSTEQDMWETISNSCYEDMIFDLCMPKARSEVLMIGKCYAPDKTAVSQLFVDLDFGSLLKRVVVFGKRYWKKGDESGRELLRYVGHDWEISEPETFLEMDIGWKNAFGGEGFEQNPWGKGFLSKETGPFMDKSSLLPNVERPNGMIIKPTLETEPAGYGPIEALWPQRAKKVGKKYGKRWEKARFPEPAVDMDPTYYNCALEDQQLKEGYWNGDEEFVITNMHAEHPEQRSCLPQIQPRCFVLQRDRERERWNEIDLHPETVWLFPNVEKGILVSRGVFEVDTFYGIDVDTLLLAWELKVGQKRASADYRKSVQLREDEDTASDWSLREDDLSPPEGIPEEEEIFVEEDDEDDDAMDPVMEKALEKPEGMLGKAKELLKSAGLDPLEYLGDAAAQVQSLPVPPPLKKMSDVGKIQEWSKIEIAKAEKAVDAYDAKVGLDGIKTQVEAKEAIENRARSICKRAGEDYDALKAKAAAKPGSSKPMLQRAAEILKKTQAELGGQPGKVQAIDNALKKIGGLTLQADGVGDAGEDAEMKNLLRGTAQYMDPPDMPSAERVAFLRDWVIKRHKAGECLADENLTGVDLSKLDLRGANFHGAMLDSANISQTNLSGADFSKATLVRADFTESVLIEANLSEAGLGKTAFIRTDLTGADLKKSTIHLTAFTGAILKNAIMKTAMIQETEFSSSIMEGAEISETEILKTSFDQAVLKNATLNKSTFMECTMAKADLSGANLEEVSFVEVGASGANFTSAKMNNANAHLDCKFANCVFSRIEGEGINFSETDLSGADFSDANIVNASFGESALNNAIFDRAIARSSDFTDADLSEASFVKTDMMKSSLQGARLARVNFNKAHLFGADLLAAKVEKIASYGAVIKRTMLDE